MGPTSPQPTRGADSADAIGFIVETCRQREGTWIVAVGPLTNVALALRVAPDLGGRIAGVSLMGGGSFGNRTAVAEFNIWADPEAAAAVFGYGGPLVMAGLDVTHQFLATPARIERISAIGGRLATPLGELLTFFSTAYIGRHDDIAGAPMHDPLAVLVLTAPDLFERNARHVSIETADTSTRGMTIIDERTLRDRPAPNCDVLRRVDVDAAFDLVCDAFTALSAAESFEAR